VQSISAFSGMNFPVIFQIAYCMDGLNGEKLLSLPGDGISEAGRSIFKFSEAFTGESVNNYFKSMKEIEAEFLSSMNAARESLKNMWNDLSHFGQNLIYMDGEINFPDPDDLQRGYMEENY
jgi:hypothetical protein